MAHYLFAARIIHSFRGKINLLPKPSTSKERQHLNNIVAFLALPLPLLLHNMELFVYADIK